MILSSSSYAGHSTFMHSYRKDSTHHDVFVEMSFHIWKQAYDQMLC